jgi:phosphoribosylformylglycinamidine synthase
MNANVIVTLKNGVLDPQGEAITKALAHLGFEGVKGVRVGKWISVDLAQDDPAKAKAQLEKMADALLANPVIEDFEVNVAGPFAATETFAVPPADGEQKAPEENSGDADSDNSGSEGGS